MQLLAYMQRDGVTDAVMAKRIGDCSASAVRKYKYRERQPDAARMLRISNITLGEVALADWAESSKLPATASAPERTHATGGRP